MKRPKRQLAKGAFELIEESVHLLRRAPAATLAIYYLGTLPFLLGLLFFWADMSRDPFASHQLAGGSLGLAGLFAWMKGWQAVFTRHLRALASRQPMPILSLRRGSRIFLTQAALQPTGLFLLPLSLLIVLPFGWMFAFYQNLSALADGESSELWRLARKAQKQAMLWQKQNYICIAILFAFGFFVFLNWCTIGYVLPGLVKTLFGVESMFTRGGSSLMNTTFFAVTLGLTYACLDPIVKAMYALRCFYGESRDSGADLKADLRPYLLSQRGLAAGVFFICLLSQVSFTGGLEASAAMASAPSTQTGPSPGQLDQKIEEVLQQRKYTWRLPREKLDRSEAQQGLIGRFLTRVGKWIRERLRAARDWFAKWLERMFRSRGRSGSGPGSGYGWIMLLQLLLYALVAVAIGALLWLLYRVIRGRTKATVVASQPIQPAPDLTDENIGADQLPEDGWSRLGRELLGRGELRLAMRAFYLASLAHLAGRNLISLAKFKSNRDYERELRRRGHSFPEVLTLFGDNVSVFDRTWYGMHEISEELITQFVTRVERLRGQPGAIQSGGSA